METIRKSEFKLENYKAITLIVKHRNGSEDYEYQDVCDRCGGRGLVVSHVENGKLVYMRPDNGICYKCLGNKYLTRKLKVITDEAADAKEAQRKKEAEEAAAKWREDKERIKQEHIEEGWKLVDFKVAGWFFNKPEDIEYNTKQYYKYIKETDKAVLIGFMESLDDGCYIEEWFPKKAIIR